MICTTLKTKNNHTPSQIANLYFDIYPQNSTNSVGALCTTNAESAYTYGGVLSTKAAANAGRPTYRPAINPLSLVNYFTNGITTSIPSLGSASPFGGTPPYGYDFTIFAVVNIVNSTFPNGAFMNDGSNNSIWLCGGASQPILTDATTGLITGTVPAGLGVVMVQRSGYNLSIRINNGTLNTILQPNTFINWTLGVGRYNSTLFYTGGLYFGRMIAYRRALSTNEITQVRNYLNKVYGTLAYA